MTSSADSEVTPSLAEVLEQHQLTDTPTWACERVCSCGENVHTLIHHRGHAAHVAAAVLASFVVLPKDQLHQEWGNTWMGQGPAINRSREDAEEAVAYLRERFPDATYEHHVVSRWVGSWKPT